MGSLTRQELIDHVFKEAQGFYLAECQENPSWEGGWSVHYLVPHSYPEELDGYIGEAEKFDTEEDAKARVKELHASEVPKFMAVVEAIVDEYLAIVGKVILADPAYAYDHFMDEDGNPQEPEAIQMRMLVHGASPDNIRLDTGDMGMVFVSYVGVPADIPVELRPFAIRVYANGPARLVGHPLPAPLKPIGQ